jgi:hypothetical protein
MDGSRRKSPGRKSRFTQSELDHIRDVHRRWNDLRRERIRLCKTMGLCSDTFNKIGEGRLGKNARPG